ncbi:MAG: hypothetical protein A2X56_12160 [Nitrospirae bacterium GWC2_57_13]|jgi:hypothetical protein|nr:MAG: hypothetical protein A2X56_12160 [Nitrospirae bacterium GWC2_57_13]
MVRVPRDASLVKNVQSELRDVLSGGRTPGVGLSEGRGEARFSHPCRRMVFSGTVSDAGRISSLALEVNVVTWTTSIVIIVLTVLLLVMSVAMK